MKQVKDQLEWGEALNDLVEQGIELALAERGMAPESMGKPKARPTVNMTEAGHLRLRQFILQMEAESGEKLTQGEAIERLVAAASGRIHLGTDAPKDRRLSPKIGGKIRARLQEAIELIATAITDLEHDESGKIDVRDDIRSTDEVGDPGRGSGGDSRRTKKEKAS